MLGAVYSLIVFLHSLNRWFVLGSGSWLAAVALSSLARKSPPSSAFRVPWMAYLGALRVQYLLGITLLVVSPVALAAWTDFSAAMRVRPLRFFSLQHPVMMIVAVGLAEAGAARAHKALDGRHAARASLVFGGLSLLLILAAVPWPFLGEIARPWLRSW